MGHTPEQNDRACLLTVHELVGEIDLVLTKWANYPSDLFRYVVETPVVQATVANDPVAQDLLMIRVQLAEALQKLAAEYVGLIEFRRKSGGEPHA
jgi:hypothetical protein